MYSTFTLSALYHIVINQLAPGGQIDGNGVVVVTHITMVISRHITGCRQLGTAGRYSRLINSLN